jgi:GNAT superfamily N-acetyltransferase
VIDLELAMETLPLGRVELQSVCLGTVSVHIYRAAETQIELAYGIVQEYYAAASVIVREDKEEFERQYFSDGTGVWLAEAGEGVIGCVALRRLEGLADSGEIKRMYLRETYRGQGVADLLLQGLEEYAREFGYKWLYLDTAADMKVAARFYERKGFVPCERYNENPQAAIYMRKSFY